MFSCLDVTSKKITEEEVHSSLVQFRLLHISSCALEVCQDVNYDFVMNYCMTFADKLPTKKEVQARALS